MKKNLRRALGTTLMILAVAVLLAGCGGFRQQALEAQTRLDDALQQAEIAENAAARNAGRIMELEDRIEVLEAALAELQETETND